MHIYVQLDEDILIHISTQQVLEDPTDYILVGDSNTVTLYTEQDNSLEVTAASPVIVHMYVHIHGEEACMQLCVLNLLFSS